MGKLVLVTGGARSGKSAFAEAQLQDQPDVCYLATGIQPKGDVEWQERVEKHRQRRPQNWQTHEGYQDLAMWLSQQSYSAYLLDCATMLTTNQLFDYLAQQGLEIEQLDASSKRQLTQHLEAEWLAIVRAAKEQAGEVWIVTNEVGLGLVPETPLGRFFRDVQGRINQLLAKEASQVYLVICGLAQQLK